MISRWWTAHLTVPRRKALSVTVLASVLLAGAWWIGHSWHREKLLAEKRGEVLAGLDLYANELVIKLNRRFEFLNALKAFIDTHASSKTLGADFESFARERIENIGAVYGAAIAPGGVMRFVYPQAENEKNLGNVLMNDPRQEVRADVARAIGRVRSVTAKRKSGELFPIEISVTEMEGEEDIPYAALIRDVSEKDRLQAQLIESERRNGHWVGHRSTDRHRSWRRDLLSKPTGAGDQLPHRIAATLANSLSFSVALILLIQT